MRLGINSKQNGFLCDDKPFFWLGDTAWLLLSKLTPVEIEKYLYNRKMLGYNVILFDLAHGKNQATPEGYMAFSGQMFNAPCKEAPYWQRLITVMSTMEKLDMVAGILPLWSSSFDKSPLLCSEVMLPYMEFVNELLADFTNFVWIIGGDIRGNSHHKVFNEMGALLKQLRPEILIGFHPFGRTTSSRWFHEEAWLDFNLYQSGHRRYDQACLTAWDDNAGEAQYGEDCYRYAHEDINKIPRKPTLDAEPSYEEILQGLHDTSQPYWQACDVRRYAYWNILSGAAGHTYGHNSIMQFYSDTSKQGAFGVKSLWVDALHHAGSMEMKNVAKLAEIIPLWQGSVNLSHYVGEKSNAKYDYIPVLSAENWLAAYSYTGKPFEIDLLHLQKYSLKAYWYSPVIGGLSYFKTLLADENKQRVIEFVPPKSSLHSDWILLLRREDF